MLEMIREMTHRWLRRHLTVRPMAPHLIDAGVSHLEYKLTGPLSVLIGERGCLERMQPLRLRNGVWYEPAGTEEFVDGSVVHIGAWYRPQPEDELRITVPGRLQNDRLYWLGLWELPDGRVRERYCATALEALDVYYEALRASRGDA